MRPPTPSSKNALPRTRLDSYPRRRPGYSPASAPCSRCWLARPRNLYPHSMAIHLSVAMRGEINTIFLTKAITSKEMGLSTDLLAPVWTARIRPSAFRSSPPSRFPGGTMAFKPDPSIRGPGLRGGVDVNPLLGSFSPFPSEVEMAMPGGGSPPTKQS